MGTAQRKQNLGSYRKIPVSFEIPVTRKRHNYVLYAAIWSRCARIDSEVFQSICFMRRDVVPQPSHSESSN